MNRLLISNNLKNCSSNLGNLDLVKKSEVKNKDYVSNEWPLNDIHRVNYPKFFCSFDSNLTNSKLDINYQDLDTKSYLNNFGISSPVGLKILNSSKKFKRKLKNPEDEIEKWCSNDVKLINLSNLPLADMIKPFELKIDRLKNCPICKKQIIGLSKHSCLKLKKESRT